MSQASFQFARRLFDDFNRDGVEAALPYFDPEIEWVPPSEWLEERIYRGHDGIRRLAAAWAENFEGYALDLERVIDVTDDEMVVLVHQRGRIKGSDAGTELRVGFDWRLRAGRIIRVDVHFSWEDALAGRGGPPT